MSTAVAGPAWPDAERLVEQIYDALEAFDWPKVERLCRGEEGGAGLLARLDQATEPFPTQPAKELLAHLRRKRRFELMAAVADAFQRAGDTDARIRRQYAQAMIDQGFLQVAEGMLGAILADPAAPLYERNEAHGLLGRISKQLYVNAKGPVSPRRRRNLERAITSYWQAYSGDRDNVWQGVNTLALLARARRDGVARDESAFPSEQELTTELQQTLDTREARHGSLSLWDQAVAFELAVARWDLARSDGREEEAEEEAAEAVRRASQYVRNRAGDAFEFASTLRQMREVWELSLDTPPGATVIPVLQEAVMRQSGGELTLTGREVRQQLVQLEKNFSGQRDLPLRWWKTGLERATAVAQIRTSQDKALGTGFLVDRADFLGDGGEAPVLLTNWHVISKDGLHFLSIRPESARVYFEGCEKGYAVKELLAYAPQLDASFVALEPMDPAVRTCPLEPPPAEFGARDFQRLYVIGHPGGRKLSFSLHDSQWLEADGTYVRYRTPTDPGSSGSPVFDEEHWSLVALHHAGSRDLPALTGDSVHDANEGVVIQAIQEAVKNNPKPLG